MAITLSQKAALLIAIPFLFQVIFVAILVSAERQLEIQYEKESHAKNELNTVNIELRLMLEAGSSLGMFHATRDIRFLKRFRECHSDLQKMQTNLLALSQSQTDLDIGEFTKGTEEVIATFDRMEELIKTEDRLDLMRSIFAGNALARKISLLAKQIGAKANTVNEQQRLKELRLRSEQNSIVFAGIVFNGALAVFVGVVFHKGTTSRLNVISKNAINLGRDLPLEPQLSGADEISKIDASFHGMAETLKRFREREAALTENATYVICSLDDSYKFNRANSAVNDLWGYDVQELIGKSVIELVIPEEQEGMLSRMKDARRLLSIPFEITTVRQDGHQRSVQCSLRWSAREKLFFAVFHDVSERKRVEKLKQEVTAMVSHDLRSPLTSIELSLSSLQSETSMTETSMLLLDRSRSSLSRLIAMINSLLDLEKLEAGGLQLARREVSVDDLIDQSIACINSMAEAKGISFLCPVNGLSVFADAEKIISVLVNLISNAVKFSPNDSVIEISTKLESKYLVFSVIDEGKGIPKEKRSLIFERFKQVDKSDETELKGSGLGLAICKKLVEAHGGRIGVKGASQRGSCFWFSLPID